MSLLDDQSDVNQAFVILEYRLSDEEQKELQELIDLDLVVRCDMIPHHKLMINPSYTYVSNDDSGRRLALRYPLFTAAL